MGDSALTRKKLFWMLSLRKLSGPRYLRGSSEVCRASPRMYRGREVEDVEVAGLPLTVGAEDGKYICREGNHLCQGKNAEYHDADYSTVRLSLCCSSFLSGPSIKTGNPLISHSTLNLHGIILFVATNKYSKHFSNLLGICIDTSLDIIFIQCFELAKQP
jgi:hypothetical protein